MLKLSVASEGGHNAEDERSKREGGHNAEDERSKREGGHNAEANGHPWTPRSPDRTTSVQVNRHRTVHFTHVHIRISAVHI